MTEYQKGRELGYKIGESIDCIDWFFSMEALVRMPWQFYKEYVPDGNREYRRGEVVRTGHEKWLLQNWGKLDENLTPAIVDDRPNMNLLKLFRDSNRYDWVREEYCIYGFERKFNNKWYRVKVPNVDDSTAPPNNPTAWEEITE